MDVSSAERLSNGPNRAGSSTYESPPEQLLSAPGDPLTHSQGSQCPGDMTSLSLGKEFHPRVASELVPRGYTQASQDETAKPKVMDILLAQCMWGVCMCVCMCVMHIEMYMSCVHERSCVHARVCLCCVHTCIHVHLSV